MRSKGKKPRRIPEFTQESERGEFYRGKALYYLEFKMRTEHEVRSYLAEWECPPAIMDEVIFFLEEYHYLDDARYAESYIRQERTLKSRSRRDITERLLSRGISRDIITAAFEQETEDMEPGADPELIQARNAAEKRMRSGHTDRAKLISFLQRKGFSYGIIRQVLEDLEFEVPDMEEI